MFSIREIITRVTPRYEVEGLYTPYDSQILNRACSWWMDLSCYNLPPAVVWTAELMIIYCPFFSVL